MQDVRGKDDGMNKVAAFLGGGLTAVTEDIPEKRAHTTNATKRPKIDVGMGLNKIRETNSSQPKLNDSVGSNLNNS